MNNIKTVKIKDFTTGDGSLTLFGGPCTAEGLELCRRGVTLKAVEFYLEQTLAVCLVAGIDDAEHLVDGK